LSSAEQIRAPHWDPRGRSSSFFNSASVLGTSDSDEARQSNALTNDLTEGNESNPRFSLARGLYFS
jgi:hypothetical protein